MLAPVARRPILPLSRAWALPIGLLLVAGAGCSSTQSIQSAPLSAPITLDGSDADWVGGIQPVTDQPGLGVGVRNNGDALYVVAVLRNESQVRQAVRNGLTLWLDPAGGTDRTLGVRFPLGASPGEAAPGNAPRGGRGRSEDLDERFASATQDLEVLQDGAESGSRLPAAGVSGVRASASLQGAVMVIEYRVPLAGSSFALGARPGATIGLGLTTPEAQRPDGAERGRGRRGGGGRGGEGGGAAAGGRGGRGGQRPGGGGAGAGRQGERAAPLDVWLGVGLSAN